MSACASAERHLQVCSAGMDCTAAVTSFAALAALRLRRPVRLVDPGVRITPGAGPALRLRYRHHADAAGVRPLDVPRPRAMRRAAEGQHFFHRP